MVKKREKASVGQIATVMKTYLSARETKRYLDCNDAFLRNLRNDGLLHVYKLRSKFYYLKSDIDTLMENNRIV